jgi:hypothetical protein
LRRQLVRLKGYLALGAVAGAVSAAAVFLPLGDAPAPKVLGYCFGIDYPIPRCDGIEVSFYLLPGLIFGIAFAGSEAWHGRLSPTRAIAFLVASGVGNAVATALCVGLTVPISAWLAIDGDIPVALAGAISGAIGGGLPRVVAKLVCSARVWRSVAAAACLGLLVPLVPEWPVGGRFVFYIVWQAGYAAALGVGWPREA